MNAENKIKSTADDEKSDSGGSAFQKHARQRSLTRPLLLASLVVVCVGLLLTWTIGRTTLCWHIGSNCDSFVTRGVAADVLIKPFSELPAPTYYASANYDADFKRGVEEGNEIARKFFGSCNADVWFLPEIRGSEADYASLADAACEHFPSKYCGTVRPIEDARTGGDDGQNYGSAHVDSNRMCDMGDSRYDRFAAWMPESEHELGNPVDAHAFAAETAIHEYVHVYQMSVSTGLVPEWLLEGGAVLMGVYMRSAYGSATSYTTFRAAFENLGGRGAPVMSILRDLYTSTTPAQKWFKDYAVDRCFSPDDGALDGAIYYDLGHIATWFMLHRAQQRDSTITLRDFWVTQGSKGFWQNLHADEAGITEWSYIGDVKEGYGWKKAVSDFSGYETYEEFADAFENWIAPGGNFISDSDILAILPTNAEADAEIGTVLTSIPEGYVAHDGGRSSTYTISIVLIFFSVLCVLLGAHTIYRLWIWCHLDDASDSTTLSGAFLYGLTMGVSSILNISLAGKGSGDGYVMPAESIAEGSSAGDKPAEEVELTAPISADAPVKV